LQKFCLGNDQDMNDRFAFAARFWGESAVVCRAAKDRPGPVVEQQFGHFATWTQASAFAAKLNEGLGIDSFEARDIVTSSFLWADCVVRSAETLEAAHNYKTVRCDTLAAQGGFLLMQLALTLTFCRSARLSQRRKSHHTLLVAENVLRRARQFLASYDGHSPELEQIASQAAELDATLQDLSFHCYHDGWNTLEPAAA
jgi:hypothetical protein